MSRKPSALLSAAWLAYAVNQSNGIVSKSATSRAQFLSAGAASVFTSSAFVAATAEECKAISGKEDTNKNPRYIQQELEMKYAEGPDGNPRSRGVLVRRVSFVALLLVITS